VIPGFLGCAFEPGDERPEERAFEVGNDGADDPAVFTAKPRSEGVDPVVERRDRFAHTIGVGGLHGGDAAHDLGDGRGRHAGLARDIVDRGPSRVLSRVLSRIALRHDLSPRPIPSPFSA